MLGLGACALAQGDLAGVREQLVAALIQFRNQGNKEGVVMPLPELGSIMGLSDRPVQAARLWGTAQAMRQAIRWGSAPHANAIYEQAVTIVRADLGEEAFAIEWAAGEC